MNYDYEQTEFSKSLLAGVFSGITAVVLCLLFNAFFRGESGFHLSALINVSTIIFVLLILASIAGVVFYFFQHYLKKGAFIFQLVTVIGTALLLVGTTYVQRSPSQLLSTEFRELLMGIISIYALCVIFMIPFLYRHDYL